MDLQIPETSTSREDGTVYFNYSTNVPQPLVREIERRASTVGAIARRTPPPRTNASTSGGSWLSTSSTGPGYCTLEFNMIKQGVYHFITAGHCTAGVTYWYETGSHAYLGTTYNSVNGPLYDYGIVRYSELASGVTKGGFRVPLYDGQLHRYGY